MVSLAVLWLAGAVPRRSIPRSISRAVSELRGWLTSHTDGTSCRILWHYFGDLPWAALPSTYFSKYSATKPAWTASGTVGFYRFRSCAMQRASSFFVVLVLLATHLPSAFLNEAYQSCDEGLL